MTAVFQTLGQLSSHLDTASDGNYSLEFVDPGLPLGAVSDIDVSNVWESQPSVRKVVEFIARSHAQVPRNLYDRVSDNERVRVTDHPIARMLRNPNPTAGMTAYRFYSQLTTDFCLHDRWCAAIVDRGDELALHRIPPRKFRLKTNALDEVTAVVVYIEGQRVEKDPANFLFDHGYASSGGNGTSPMRTMRDLLNEQTESVKYRRDLWKRGARFGGVISREKEWPNPKARRRFNRGFQRFASGGASAGAWLLLEDGMTAKQIESVKPLDAQDLEGRKLSDIQVASGYHIAPELIGAREGTFSNIKAFLEALYGPALGPMITAFDQSFNAALTRTTSLYIEANVDAMLRGNFEDQQKAYQVAVGAPWMTRNEARARSNQPPIDGGDELVTPLNVLIGRQANPRDSAPKAEDLSVPELVPPAELRAKAGRPLVKARAPETYTTKTEQVLAKFFERQGAVVLSALGAGKDDWWDGDRWDTELAEDLYKLAVMTSTDVAEAALKDAGLDTDEYDTERTLAFLKSVAESRASMVNSTTRDQVQAVLDDEDEDHTPAAVFEAAPTERVPTAAAALVTTFSAFAINEVGRQVAPDTATKTWLVSSANPRTSHAAMDGETVGIDEKFSNGMNWPGDPVGGADEVAGCQCELELNFQ